MKRDFYLFSGTHWDREWYQTFQTFRYRLVKMLDGVIEAWEKEPRFGVFHLDGQTVPLEDYAEIEPVKAEKLKALVKEGKVKIGPWFVMPDEFNLSGESLVRNLMLGHELSKKWGAEDAWKFGYMCDIFGHIAQMPQILRGFDISYSLFMRGYYADAEPYFIWRSPDGSEVINIRVGYCEFTHEVAEKGRVVRTYEQAKEPLAEYLDRIISTTEYPIHIMMDATDHKPLRLNSPDFIEGIKQMYPDASVHHCDLIEAGHQLEAYRERLCTVTGEMNYTNKAGFPELITNVLSSYYPLKKANDTCQNMLEGVIEPMLATACMAGRPMNRAFLRLAYRYLLLNHPHDSIGGCSRDQVHKDMEYRFDQTLELCETLRDDYLTTFGRAEGYDPERDTDAVLTVYNTLPFDRDEVVTVPLYMRQGYKTRYSDQAFGFEFINSFKILDSDGNEVPYQLHSIRRSWRHTLFEQHVGLMDLHNVTLNVKVPAGGQCEYRIVPSERPMRYLEYMRSGADYMENDLIRIDIAPDGTLTLTDKPTGKIYSDQLILADDSEIGDGWYHANAREDRTVYSRAGKCRIEKIENGCARVVFRITKEMEVPASLVIDQYSQYRSSNYVTCTAVFEVGLSKNARYADVRMTYINRAENHRVRLVIPTRCDGDKYFADQAFCFVERHVGIDYSTQNYREFDQYEKSMLGTVGKRGTDGCGLAFVAPAGLHECASTDDSDATLYVTLLRGFKRTVQTNGEVRGQLLGEHSYRFALVPIDADTTYAELANLKSRLGCELITRYAEIDQAEPIQAPVSSYRVDGKNISLSVLKCAEREDGAIVARVCNLSNEPGEAKIELSRDISAAFAVNLNEEPSGGKTYAITGRSVTVPVAPWHIESVMLKL